MFAPGGEHLLGPGDELIHVKWLGRARRPPGHAGTPNIEGPRTIAAVYCLEYADECAKDAESEGKGEAGRRSFSVSPASRVVSVSARTSPSPKTARWSTVTASPKRLR